VRAALAEVDPLLATLQNYSSVVIAAQVRHLHRQQSLRNWPSVLLFE
jgi:menaquinone-dependent protoporphyrinogen IX oxidase